MKYLRFNHTDLDVAALCLGTSPFGTSLTRNQAVEQMEMYVSSGGNFFDTAHVYGDWEPGERARSERIIGEWIKKWNSRSKVVLSTKGGHPLLETMDISRVSLPDLEMDLQGSLEALQTEFIDLYFLHRDNPQLPVAEIMDWLEEQKAKGRIRYYGCSNWSLPRIIDAQRYALAKGYTGFVCNQIQDSLADSSLAVTTQLQMVVADKSFETYHQRTGMNRMAYMALAHGYFSKMQLKIPLPDDEKELYDLPQNATMFEVMKSLPSYTVNDFSYQYILQRPYPSIPITSFETIGQMKEAIASCSKDIPIEIINKISAFKRHD